MISPFSVLSSRALRVTCIAIQVLVLLTLFLTWSPHVLPCFKSLSGDCFVNLYILLSLFPISLLSKTSFSFVTNKIVSVIIIRPKICNCWASSKIEFFLLIIKPNFSRRKIRLSRCNRISSDVLLIHIISSRYRISWIFVLWRIAIVSSKALWKALGLLLVQNTGNEIRRDLMSMRISHSWP